MKKITYADVYRVLVFADAVSEGYPISVDTIEEVINTLSDVMKYVWLRNCRRLVGVLSRLRKERGPVYIRSKGLVTECSDELRRLSFILNIDLAMKTSVGEKVFDVIIGSAMIRGDAVTFVGRVRSERKENVWYRVSAVFPLGVFVSPVAVSCSCPAFTYRTRGRACKHVNAFVEAVRELVRSRSDITSFDSYVFSYWKPKE